MLDDAQRKDLKEAAQQYLDGCHEDSAVNRSVAVMFASNVLALLAESEPPMVFTSSFGQEWLRCAAMVDALVAERNGSSDPAWHGHNMVKLHREDRCYVGGRIFLTPERYDAVDRWIDDFFAAKAPVSAPEVAYFSEEQLIEIAENMIRRLPLVNSVDIGWIHAAFQSAAALGYELRAAPEVTDSFLEAAQEHNKKTAAWLKEQQRPIDGSMFIGAEVTDETREAR